MMEAFAELGRGVHTALEAYSDVHRGSGHNLMVSTHLFEQARNIVLECLGLKQDRYVVIFCTPRRAELLTASFKSGSLQIMSSQNIGLPLGVRALAVERKALPGGALFQAGGGTEIKSTSLDIRLEQLQYNQDGSIDLYIGAEV